MQKEIDEALFLRCCEKIVEHLLQSTLSRKVVIKIRSIIKYAYGLYVYIQVKHISLEDIEITRSMLRSWSITSDPPSHLLQSIYFRKIYEYLSNHLEKKFNLKITMIKRDGRRKMPRIVTSTIKNTG